MVVSIQAFMWAVGILLTVILALIGFIVGYILRIQEKAEKKLEDGIYQMKADLHIHKTEVADNIKKVTEAQNEIKFNYLKRFEEVNKNVVTTKEEVIEKLHELHTVIINIQK